MRKAIKKKQLCAERRGAYGSSGGSRLDIRLSSIKNGQDDEDLFTCRDKVYAYITFPEETAGVQMVGARWYRPDGSLHEAVQASLDFSRLRTACFSMDLRAAAKGTGEEDVPGGAWSFQVIYDNGTVAQKRFHVIHE